MKIEKHSFPWDHWTIKNSLSPETARRCFNACTANRGAVYRYGKRSGQTYEKRTFLESMWWQKELDATWLNPTLLPYIKENCSKHYKFQEGDRWRLEFTADPPGFYLDMHPDIKEKKLSLMVYLGQETNEGTTLYDGKGKTKHVPSGFNTGMFFFPDTHTLHGFPKERAVPRYRYAIILNIVDKNFSEEPTWPVTF